MAMPFTRQNIQTHQDLREKKRQKRLPFKVFAIVQLESLYCSKRFQLKKVPMCMQSSPKSLIRLTKTKLLESLPYN